MYWQLPTFTRTAPFLPYTPLFRSSRSGDFPIVCASAMPAVESRVNARAGRYHLVHMPTRFGEAAMPDLHLVDMRRHPPERGGFLSPVLLRAMGRDRKSPRLNSSH